jgi:Tat protein translocase TatB subunit
MFGIGMPELLLILAVALIVIGPKKLPDLAKSLGKAMGEFKRATNDLKQSIEQETGLDEVRHSLREADRDMRRSFTASDSPSPAPASENDDPAQSSQEGQETAALAEPPEPAVTPAGDANDAGNKTPGQTKRNGRA